MNLPPEALVLPRHLVETASILPDRYALLPLLPRRAVFAEIGVGLGDFSDVVLAVCDPKLFVAIDEFRLHELPDFWGREPSALFRGQTHAEAYRARFAEAVRDERLRVIAGDSAECLERLDNASLDVAYIDADHRYEYVRRDLEVARRKVRPDGWIVVNDYIMVAELRSDLSYGVVHATHEFMMEHCWAMQHLALQTRMFCDVVIRPRGVLASPAARLASLADENERLRAEVAALRASTSWRLTARLRGLSRLGRAAVRGDRG